MRPALGLTSALALGLLLGGCGQKGPLYLPDDKAAAERYGIPEQSAPAQHEVQQQEQQEEQAAPATDDKRDS